MKRVLWLGAAAVGAVLCAVGAVFYWAAFTRAWLAAALTLGLIPLGAIPALLTFGLTGGGWGRASAGAWRALLVCLPLFGLAMLPLLFNPSALFPWLQPVEQLPEVVRHKLLYLNWPFFLIRFAAYFAVWLTLAAVLGWGRRIPGPGACAAGIILWVFACTFFGFDWLLSLEPKFYTDVFGLWLCISAVAAATAIVLCTLPGATEEQISRRADLANLWLAVLLGWVFLGYSQYIIIWQGNMPHEIGWYVHRGHGLWRALGWAMFFLLFAIPFAMLLSGRVKRSGRMLKTAAGVMLAGYVLQVQWWVLPAFEASPALAVLAPLTVATLALLGAGAVSLVWSGPALAEQTHG